MSKFQTAKSPTNSGFSEQITHPRATTMTIQILENSCPSYRLLDSGNRRKLEQFGDVRIIRSEPKAWWQQTLPQSEWRAAVASFEDDSREGSWRFKNGKAPEPWALKFRDEFTLQLRFMERSKQIGIFPEQSPHWDFILKNRVPATMTRRLLNLFGYTGAASLAAAKAGWQVAHVDASKPAIAWGRRNQELSGMASAPIRWILEDATKFCTREVRRGNKYDAILLDPPAFGRGPDGELWKIERDLPPLLEICKRLLSENASLAILTLYTVDASSILCGNIMREMTSHLGGNIEIGELATRETSPAKRLLPLSLWAKWTR
ncbi:MAG: class I SAM-dependent methyltransferase [Opitutae bacterium]|nr:class I SAM-dependent methyltransferase [Opitutae bacterium]